MTREEIENIPKNVNTLLDSSVTIHTRQKLNEKLNKVCELAIKALEQEPKTGHWIVHPKGIYTHLVCDNCLSRAPYDCKTNYCPTCGRRMVEPQESEG